MVGRALSLAAVVLTLCCLGKPIRAQENLDAGKSPSQLFAGTCAACHKSPRGLLKTTAPGSLPGFLRQHYTTSPEMAGVLANYLISNGANDTRYTGGQAKDGKETKPDARSEAKPDTDAKPSGLVEQLGRWGRKLRSGSDASEPSDARQPSHEAEGASQKGAGSKARGSKRAARSTEAKPDTEVSPAQAEDERGSEGHKASGKHSRKKKSKPADEATKPDASSEEPAEAAKLGRLKSDDGSIEQAKPVVQDRPAPPKSEASHDTEPSATRADPVPPVTPASSDPSVTSSPR